MIRCTQRRPVNGSVHSRRIFASPRRDTCSIVTTTRRAPATRSIAPPIPFTIFPGIM
jgi:hypothetical protein